MTANTQQTATGESFMRFWTDMMSQMAGLSGDSRAAGAGGGATAAPKTMAEAAGLSDESMKQMQRLFFDALARYCEEFMRSEQFLSAMKQMMDRSLAFKRQVDAFLTQAMHGMHAPARADVEDLTSVLRSVEERVLSRLDRLENEMAEFRGGARASRAEAAPATRANRPRGTRKPAQPVTRGGAAKPAKRAGRRR